VESHIVSWTLASCLSYRASIGECTGSACDAGTILVGSYPAQERVGGDAKIPSIMYYDRNGSVRAVGAEALLESNVEIARDEEWVKVEW